LALFVALAWFVPGTGDRFVSAVVRRGSRHVESRERIRREGGGLTGVACRAAVLLPFRRS